MAAAVRLAPFSLVVFCFLFTFSLPATATSVTVTGSGFAGEDTFGFNVTAGNFSASSASPGGNSILATGLAGVPMTLSWGAAAFQGPDCCLVTVGNQFTDFISGGILFTSTFTIPASAVAAGTFTTPVSVSGFLQAYRDLTLGQGYLTQGPLLSSLRFTGTGTATFALSDTGGSHFTIDYGAVDFNGKGTLQTTVPEPSSLFLMGTGLVALAGIVRRKWNFSRQVEERLAIRA